jgi:hypothetical protein
MNAAGCGERKPFRGADFFSNPLSPVSALVMLAGIYYAAQ